MDTEEISKLMEIDEEDKKSDSEMDVDNLEKIDNTEEGEGEYMEKWNDTDYWQQYVCLDCNKLIDGAVGLVDHRRDQEENHALKPLWSFNQNEVMLQDLRYSRKFGVMIRELEQEYREHTESVNTIQADKELKLKIGRGTN